MKIKKKVWPEYFERLLGGSKTYELRLADFECNPGDVLVLEEWDPKTGDYTGRTLEKTVTYVDKFKIDKLFWPKEEIEKHGLQVISLK
ncbi:MAG: hypothetical protein A3D24_01060 [Candidatus Blackburnbacteria bacterium RIFCSPHIGHO2_02_FULL_39_13]|uniref:DUF3850 domain-containing protein n=1 Tax=Candidatus Blackburnbacteria bacterium RIFCSPLOWO2_01_FULL_40_20 TaxID=1797519 RepID=A0A1G1VFJ3_9BACT|nr:MAG: hypothetical protein A2694_04240 [Candidatus Blackburnbacteria bacterium RIFCSPHIGHO2_01_FULL_40_17]OGY08050.1 MAG: hypothetical protein A3D24_01060 [Candidatus Blackburnbacteria bacterium RIFCSPHIGHO2_02_FULL_39_13]OGY14139.1 MAG: hypothetical protein A3A77_04740 [Candidatus Blackburnbacteria bacterium RIFCSPLOWO2_01_FULL_40_20]OGY15435.1 MAG: hypothetical protein A3I52_01865 [Candidatus Blackburnbacteria bacterium RIFCSPLOWO2_02_FULL_40_10]HBL52464.1 hypothetical protein [Candidatus B